MRSEGGVAAERNSLLLGAGEHIIASARQKDKDEVCEKAEKSSHGHNPVHINSD